MLGLGLGISRSGVIIRGVAFSPEYQAVLTEATAQGYALPSAGQQVKQNTLMTSLISTGVFAKLDVLFVLANDGGSQFACINWKNPTGTKATLVSSPTFTANKGFTGNGSNSFINTNYNPNGSLNYKLNDASRYIYLRTFTNPPSSSMDGVAGSIANGTTTFISPNQRINQGGGNNFSQTVNFQSVGMKSIHRLNNDVVIFQNTTRIDGTAASTGLAGESQVILRSANGYGAHQVSFYAMGASLVSENNSLVLAFSTYLENILNLSPEALAWRNNIVNNGGTITDSQLTFMDTWFFKPAIAAGNILTELDRLNIYCNLVGSEIAARTNMINSNHFVSPVNSPIFDINGYRSNGTSSYLNLNYNPFSQGVKYTQNSGIVMFGVLNPQFNATRNSIGCENSGTSISKIRRGSGFLASWINRASAATASIFNTGAISGKVSIGGIRKTSNTEFNIINGIEYAGTTLSSVSPPNLSCFELSWNTDGSVNGFDTETHLYSLHGSAALNVSALQTILNNLYTAAGI
jgi:hypothetical protein